MDGSVWFVAVQAVVAHGFMLEQEWSALFGVTAVARLVDRRLLEQLRVRRAVRIMAACAGQLALANWHVRRAPELRLAVLVALEAGFELSRLRQLEPRGRLVHDLVTACAGKAAQFVLAAAPMGAHAAFVAA